MLKQLLSGQTLAVPALWLRWQGGHMLSTLLFHRVPRNRDPISPSELVLEEFERVLDQLTEHTQVLPLTEALQRQARGQLPRRAVALTFDDGYAEWLDVVAPALRTRGLQATFFVTTGHLTGGAMWHERINAAVAALPVHGAKLPYGLAAFADLTLLQRRVDLAQALQRYFKHVTLQERFDGIEALEAQAVKPLRAPRAFNADSVRELRRQGFEIGAHTVHHPILSAVADAVAREEIGQSKEQLEAILGERVPLFAYPNGVPLRDFDQRHVDMVKACGFEGAVITGGGVAGRGTDRFLLPRFSPWASRPGRELMQLAGNAWLRQGVGKRHHDVARPAVLFVENGSGFGGSVVALQTLVNALPRDRFDYHVITNLPVGDFDRHPAIRSHQVIGDEVFDFRPLASRLGNPGTGSWNRALLFLLGRADDLVNLLPHMVRLWWAMRRIRPVLVHGNNETSDNRGALLVAWLMGVPYVQHMRGSSSLTLRSRGLMSRPRMYIAVSRWLCEELLHLGVPAGRVHHIYDAVRIDATVVGAAPDLRRQLGIEPGTTVVAMVGMLLSWKGQSLFLDAVARMPPPLSGVLHLIVGGEPERGEPGVMLALQDKLAELGLGDRVRMVGQVNHLSRCMGQFDVVVSASLWPEPLGLVMLEAMVAGCVFVGPKHGAATEVVVDGHNGFLFAPGSADALAAKLGEAIVAARHRPELRQAARETVSAWFAPEVCAQHTASVHAALSAVDLYP
jgi:glycosyltransferase involved in cell wall biosynthesis/peptidoglycan/xylan/chitin deacetylase (PgdA/CDA1 family)